MENGRLYIIATPIGNLKDITLRALDTLKQINFIACEDTRITKRLVNHYEIKKEMISFNARTETKKIDYILSRIEAGESCGLLSDAGTPCISDPGIRLVNKAILTGVEVIGIPGPNAAILALSVSGLPTDSFIFEGFIPQKKGRQKKLKEIAAYQRTIVLYESTYRIEKLLNELAQYMPERFIVICRELTKKFEEKWQGTPTQLLDELSCRTIKGEFVVIISPPNWKINFNN